MRIVIFSALIVILGGYFLLSRGSEKPAQEPLEMVATGPAAVVKTTPKPPSPVPVVVAKPAPQGGGTDFSSALADGLRDAQDLVDRGKSAEALELLRRKAAADPAHPEWRARLGAFLLQEAKDYPAATAELKAAYIADPSNSRALRDLTESLSREKDYGKAVATLEQVRKALPGKNEPAVALSDLMLDHRDPDAAIRVLAEASKNPTPDPQIYDRMAEASHQKKDYKSESFYLKKTEDIVEHEIRQPSTTSTDTKILERDRGSLILDRAASLADQGKMDEARTALNTVVEHDLRNGDRVRYERIRQGVNQ